MAIYSGGASSEAIQNMINKINARKVNKPVNRGNLTYFTGDVIKISGLSLRSDFTIAK